MHGRPRSMEDPVDIRIGARLKSLRLRLDMSQEDVADAIGLTYQQVQKYEVGSNRISVSRLVAICKALKTPPRYFFEDIETSTYPKLRTGFSDIKQQPFEDEIYTRKDIRQLINAYMQIQDPQLQKTILDMAKAMASDSNKTIKN